MRESDERLRAVVAHLHEGLIVADPQGSILTWNRAALEMHGHPDETDEAVVPTVFASLPDIYDGLTLEGRLLSFEEWPMSRLLRGERLHDYEMVVRNKQKGIERVFSYNGSLLRDSRGEPQMAVLTMHDVTEHRQVEAERERLLAELEATVEAAPAGVVAYDPSGRIVRMNAAAARIMGYVKADLALPMPDLFVRLRFESADGRPMSLAEYPPARALGGERVGSVSMAFRRAGEGGRRTWIYDGAGPIRARDGTLLGAVVSFVDITELHELQERQIDLLGQIAARASELTFERDRLRTVIESIADAVFVCDAAGTITLTNAAGLALIGEERETSLRTLADYQAALRPQYPDGRPVPVEELAVARALNGVTERGREEVGVHPRTGAAIHLLVSTAPLRDPVGQVVGAVSVLADVTRVTELAQVAQRRAAELQAVLDNMVDAVLVWAPDGRLTLTNAAAVRLFGMQQSAGGLASPAEFSARFRIRHPDGRPVEPREIASARALAGETIAQTDTVFFSPQFGQDRYSRISAAPIRDDSGRIVGAVTVVQDVTELAEFDRLKDQFISVAAHELKTPVAVMKGYAQVLSRTADGLSVQQRWMLDAVERGANRIDGVVRDLLDVSQLHLGRLTLRPESVSLPQLVERVVDRMALTTTKRRLRVTSAEAPAVVQGDRERLEEVVLTLVDNAIRYSPAGGEVVVAVTVAGGEAVVSVRDEGVGIPREKQPRIFERFYRAHTGTPYDYGGMGVGLYIASEIVKRHGGRMWFESEEGKGSTFSFALPIAPGEA